MKKIKLFGLIPFFLAAILLAACADGEQNTSNRTGLSKDSLSGGATNSGNYTPPNTTMPNSNAATSNTAVTTTPPRGRALALTTTHSRLSSLTFPQNRQKRATA